MSIHESIVTRFENHLDTNAGSLFAIATPERVYHGYVTEYDNDGISIDDEYVGEEAYIYWTEVLSITVEDRLCEGHLSTNGRIGNVEYCDGTCQGPITVHAPRTTDQEG